VTCENFVEHVARSVGKNADEVRPAPYLAICVRLPLYSGSPFCIYPCLRVDDNTVLSRKVGRIRRPLVWGVACCAAVCL
jgi:hypothetical protein